MSEHLPEVQRNTAQSIAMRWHGSDLWGEGVSYVLYEDHVAALRTYGQRIFREAVAASGQAIAHVNALAVLTQERDFLQQQVDDQAMSTLDAAREAIEALENTGGYPASDFDHIKGDAIDAIDALRGEACEACNGSGKVECWSPGGPCSDEDKAKGCECCGQCNQCDARLAAIDALRGGDHLGPCQPSGYSPTATDNRP